MPALFRSRQKSNFFCMTELTSNFHRQCLSRKPKTLYQWEEHKIYFQVICDEISTDLYCLCQHF